MFFKKLFRISYMNLAHDDQNIKQDNTPETGNKVTLIHFYMAEKIMVLALSRSMSKPFNLLGMELFF